MFLIDIRCEAELLAESARRRGWSILQRTADGVPHLVVLAEPRDLVAIRGGTQPRAAAPIVLISGADIPSPPGVDEVMTPPVSDAEAGAILDRWRPHSTDNLARIEAVLGTAAVNDMLLRMRRQLADALDDGTPLGMARRAHRLGGIAGMLGFTALGKAWLDVERGAPDAPREARVQTRRALAAIARRLY